MADQPPPDLLTPPSDLTGPPPDLIEPTLANQQTSGFGAFGRGAARGALPATGGLAGAVAGGELGMGLGSLTGPAAPIAAPILGFVGGLGGAYLGSEGVQKLQDQAFSLLPEKWRSAIGQDQTTEQADIAQHPYASFAGELAPNLAFLRPGKIAAAVPEGAGLVRRALQSPTAARLAGATVMGGQEAGSEEAQTGQIDPGKVAIAASAGALMNRPTRAGEAVISAASAPQRALTNIATGKPAGAPPAAQDAANLGANVEVGGQPVSPTAPPPDLQAPTGPEGSPAAGEAVGLRFKSGPPQRGVVDHYFDNGNAVRLRMDDGSVHDLTTADLAKNRTEPPAPMQPEPQPVGGGQQLGMGEAPFPPDDLIMEPYQRPPAPAEAPLGGDMLNALDHADSLEKMALNGSLNLSAGARQDMLTESARLRRQYGHQPDVGVPPNAYQHPMAGEPAADLGELALARTTNPALYEGERAAPPPAPAAPTTDPYALEDVLRARSPLPKDQTLFDAIRQMGGIKDDRGNVAQIMQGFKNPPFKRRVLNPQGISPDEVRNNLQQNGWFGQFEDQFGPDALETGSYPGDDIKDLYDLMDREARGNPVYHPDSEVPTEISYRQQLDEDMGRAGVTNTDSNEEAARKLADYRQSELAAQRAWEQSQATHQDLSPETEQGLEPHGYDPGADIGEESEDVGSREEGAERPPSDLISEGGNYESGEPVAGPEPVNPEDYTGERTDIGRGIEQTVIPGAERSAQQLAEAREAAGRGRMRTNVEQKPPGDLFAEPDKQMPLFEQPSDLISRRIPGDLTPLDDELSAWLERSGVPNTSADYSHGVRNYLLERERATDSEALAMHDSAANKFPHAATQNLPDKVDFTGAMRRDLANPASAFMGHHNHPTGRSLSREDIGTLAYPGMRAVIAHTADGNWYSAALSPAWRKGLLSAVQNEGIAGIDRLHTILRNAVKGVQNELSPDFQAQVDKGVMSLDEAEKNLNHAVNVVLDHKGVIEYKSSKEMSDESQKIVSRFLDNRLFRPPGPVLYDRGIREILGAIPESAKPEFGPSGSDEGGGEDSGPAGVKEPEGFPGGINEAGDRVDSAADEMAEALRTAPPGTYRRTLSRMSPPSGDMIFKDPNAVQNVTIRPETLARMDSRSAAIWNAEKAKEYDANTMVDDLRQRISGTMLKLDDAQRRNVYAARELDRINGLTRVDTGHQIVARNQGADFAHFSKPGDTVTLSPAETDAYHALSDMFDRAWKNIMEGAARKVGWNGAWDKDDMAANIANLKSESENHPDKGTAKVANRAAKIVSALDEQRRQGYHPLMRFGDYYAHVTPKMGTDMSSTGGFPKTVRFELAEKRLQDGIIGGRRVGNQPPPYAKDMLDRLKAQYPADKFNVEHGYLAKNPDMLDKVDIPAIEKLMTFMENDMLHSMRQEGRARGLSKSEAAADAQKRYDDLYGATVDRLWEKTFKELESGYKKKSATVPGYSDDFDRALGTYMHWTSRNVADQVNRNAIDEAHTAMDTDPRVNSDVKQYWRNWKDYQSRPSNIFNKSVNGMARWGFLTSMGLNPSSTAVVGTHGLFMAGPTLSVGIGMDRAAPAYARAMQHAIGAIKVDGSGLHIDDVTLAGRTPQEKALLKDMDAQGILHSRAIEDMSALNDKQSDLWGSAKTQARKFMDMALSNVSVMDRANRIASALSAYRLAQDPKTLAAMDEAWKGNQIYRERAEREGVNPESMARFMAPNMVGEYGRMNRAPIERNAATKMMMGMHGFVTRLLSKMWQLGTMGPQGQQALLWTLGAFWTMAGVNGVPFTQDVQNAADQIWKAATGKDPMLGYRIQAGLASMFGKAGAEMIMRGPVSTLSGVDIASRLGLGDLITRNWPTAENTLGAYPSIILGRVLAASQDIRQGHPGYAPTEFLPAGARNIIRAGRERDTGVTSQAGRVEVPARELTPADTAARGLGFTPEKAERVYERNDYRYRERRAKMSPPPNPIPQSAGGRTKKTG